ncbi:MAG TPA: asparagine--tRNA ligase [Cytophagaceae bacterium]|jgi:asparaginyl-tRNA synthetase
MKRIKIKDLFSSQDFESEIVAKGWVRTKRGNKNVSFIALNDGSCLASLQVVADATLFSDEDLKQVTTGACIKVKGKLVMSQGQGQAVELQATEIEVYGAADPEKYPLQPKEHSLEFLREIAHLRPRTNTFGAIFRIRHAMAFAVHNFFNNKGFVYLHTPIVTGSDAEGAGEMFRVTTLDPLNAPKNEDGTVNYKEDFFGKETNLTVSGQLEGELGALALSEIYTFGPTFRAENSNTARHLAEFWMIEPEVAFNDIVDNMDLAEEFLKYLVQYALDNCLEDLKFLETRLIKEEEKKRKEERSEMPLIEKLQFVVNNSFERLTYTQAVEILERSKPNQKGQFNYPVSWGTDLQSEHERYLVEKHFKKPVILTDYPAKIKAFYMKLSEDGKTVKAMDVLFPGIGEIIGGSQREENYDKLLSRVKEVGIHEKDIWWYLETRKFGTAPHAGFGLGFERLILFITGMGNIRDVIPFPRTPQSAEF